MKFKKFTSLDNSYQKRIIGMIKEQGIDGECPWFVAEKLDGANFAVYVSKDEIKYASRNQFVNDGFFDCRNTVTKYIPHMKEIFEWKNKDNTLEYVIFRGELFGVGIQNRVYYGEKDFRLIEVESFYRDDRYSLETTTSLECILNHGESEFKLKTVPIIGVFDTLDEALAANKDFKSLLTPEDYAKDNWSEGIVISTVVPKYFTNGSRVYLKNKSNLFQEKSSKKQREIPILSNNDKDKLNDVLVYLNESRVLSATSKIGNQFSQFGDILKEVKKDIEKDFLEDNKNVWYSGCDNVRLLSKEFQSACSSTIREVLKSFQ